MIRFCHRLLCLLVLFPVVAAAQHAASPAGRGCATNEVTAMLLQQDAAFAKNLQQIEKEVANYLRKQQQQREHQDVVTIPVVFHVVYSQPTENIPEAQLRSQLEVLNEDFRRKNPDTTNTPAAFGLVAADTKIEFCLATVAPDGSPTNGITRTSTTKVDFSTNNDVKFSSRGGKDGWPRNEYLNIWVASLADDVLGYAQIPGGLAATDGVVLHYTTVGRPPFNLFPQGAPYNMGRTGTHEVGHWLGLSHTWGNNEKGCNDDDGIADTPPQDSATAGCPTRVVISCGNGPNGNMWQNYMDYTNDACMNLFTRGQANRMQAILNTSRNSITTSGACAVDLTADFRASDSVLIAGDTISFFDTSIGSRTSWQWTFEGAQPSSSTQQHPTGIRYANPGTYSVTLTVRNSSETDTETKTNYITVAESGVRFFPSPATDVIHVVLPSAEVPDEIHLITITGQVVRKLQGQRHREIPVAGLPGGIYFIRVIKGNDVQNYKVLIY